MENAIKKRRLQLGLTMLEVATAIGVNEGTISRWESGKIANMKRDKIYKLSQVLSMDLNEIIDTNFTFERNKIDTIEKYYLLDTNEKKLVDNLIDTLIAAKKGK